MGEELLNGQFEMGADTADHEINSMASRCQAVRGAKLSQGPRSSKARGDDENLHHFIQCSANAAYSPAANLSRERNRKLFR